MNYLVDTDWVVDYLKGRPPVVNRLSVLALDGLAVSLITYGEIYEGINLDATPRNTKQAFAIFYVA
jgi:predicted nucleic acid-binding protein